MIRMRRRRAAVLGTAAAALACQASCRDPTAVEIEIRTTLAAGELTATSVFVGPDPFVVEGRVVARFVTSTTTRTDATGFVGTLVIVPPSDDVTTVAVAVVGGVGRAPETCTPSNGYFGCVVARRRLAYRAGERLRVPIVLEALCTSVPCDAVTTCRRGACASSEVSCSGEVCGEPGALADGGTLFVDGSALDGAPEAAADAGADAPADVATGDVNGGDAPSDGGDRAKYIDCPPGNPCFNNGNTSCCVRNGTGSCQLSMAGCADGILIRCDGPEDCAPAAKCCVSANSTGCFAGCAATATICHDNADCLPGMSCVANAYATHYGTCQ